MRSVIIWGLGIVLTIFVGIVSLEGTIATTVDGITVKTAKFMFSNGVPVVGKLLGDSIDTILRSTVVLKDVVGIVGVIILLALLLTPIVKILIFLFMYNITSILIQPFAESRIVKSLEEVSEGIKIVLALVLTVNIMFIIGIVSTLKMTNAITMFR
jgi:stage III sporulation protein AE